MDMLITDENAEQKKIEPKFGSVITWRALTGMSERATYDHLAAGNLIAVKVGKRNYLDIEKGLAWLASQPRAKIKPQIRRKSD